MVPGPRAISLLRKLAAQGALGFPGARAGLLAGCGAAILFTAAQSALPLAMGAIVDTLLGSDARALFARIALLVGAAVVSTLARGVYQTAFAWLGERCRAKLQPRLLARLHGLPMSFFDREQSGRVQSLLNEDAATVARRGSYVLSEAVVGASQLVFVVAALAMRYRVAALAALAMIPIYTVLPVVFARRTRDAAREALAATAEANTALCESLQAVREVKVFGREAWSVARLSRRLAVEESWQVRLAMLRSAYGLNYMLYWVAAGAVYWQGWHSLHAGRLTVGELVAIVVLLGFLESPVSRLTYLVGEIQRVAAAADRIAELTGAEAGRVQAAGDLELPARGHRVCYEGVELRYRGAATPAVREIGFTVEPGERVAIVGPSGAGKSTLVALLARLYDPQQGRILIDGEDVRAYRLDALRREVGFVLQDTMLFAGTVRDNVRFGQLDAIAGDIEESCRLANAHEFIARLPGGYDAQVGERGVQLSGGQRQRIGIARVLLRKPGILVLDEATSALDDASERLVREALERLMRGRTTFVISHRPSAFVHADRILVLEGGRIVAMGRHHDLLESSAVYRTLLGGAAAAMQAPVALAGAGALARLPRDAGALPR